jgi:ABC-2 type transport system permease protein
MMATGIIVTVFYCLDAMYGERRDRSLLFWKSLPVSDWTAVLAKVSIPLLLLPLLVFLVAVAMQWVMVLFSTAVLLASGVSIAPMWRALSLPNMWGLMLYHMIAAHALWPAPFYCWLLFVSAWARRAPFLWATLPLVVVALVEKVALGSSHFLSLVAGRFIGNASAVTAMQGDMFPTNPMTHITPGAFLSNPGLWIGLLIAAAFVAAAVHLRRSQGPL